MRQDWEIQLFLVKAYRSELRKFIGEKYPYQWFCSMNLNRPNYNQALEFLKLWRIALSTRLGMRISYVGVLNYIPHPHIHLLALGLNKYNLTLQDFHPLIGEKIWGSLTRQSAVVIPLERGWDVNTLPKEGNLDMQALIKETILDVQTFVSYICNKNTPYSGYGSMHQYNFELIPPYGSRLLKKSKSMEQVFYDRSYMSRYRMTIASLERRYRWQCIYTLYMDRLNVNYANMFLKKWRKEVMKDAHIKIAYKGVLIRGHYDEPPHIYLFAVGINKASDDPCHFDQLKRIDIAWWNHISNRNAKKRILVKPADYLDLYSYIFNKNKYIGFYQLIEPYNEKLLKRFEWQSYNIPSDEWVASLENGKTQSISV
ncbi:MAG: hypothetical protein ABSB79_14265 [Syntrophales bacterium]|jgi:hypothetical protein